MHSHPHMPTLSWLVQPKGVHMLPHRSGMSIASAALFQAALVSLMKEILTWDHRQFYNLLIGLLLIQKVSTSFWIQLNTQCRSLVIFQRFQHFFGKSIWQHLFKERDERAASPFNRVPSADAFGFNANCRKSTSTRAEPNHLELIGNWLANGQTK